jgi:hypothetical protein
VLKGLPVVRTGARNVARGGRPHHVLVVSAGARHLGGACRRLWGAYRRLGGPSRRLTRRFEGCRAAAALSAFARAWGASRPATGAVPGSWTRRPLAWALAWALAWTLARALACALAWALAWTLAWAGTVRGVFAAVAPTAAAPPPASSAALAAAGTLAAGAVATGALTAARIGGAGLAARLLVVSRRLVGPWGRFRSRSLFRARCVRPLAAWRALCQRRAFGAARCGIAAILAARPSVAPRVPRSVATHVAIPVAIAAVAISIAVAAAAAAAAAAIAIVPGIAMGGPVALGLGGR